MANRCPSVDRCDDASTELWLISKRCRLDPHKLLCCSNSMEESHPKSIPQIWAG